MGLNTLAEKTPGQIQSYTWWNAFRNALLNQLVGRNGAGQPVAGQELGTATYPWGTLFTQNVVVNGQTGDVRGHRPWSAWKIAGAVLAVAIVVAIFYFFNSQ